MPGWGAILCRGISIAPPGSRLGSQPAQDHRLEIELAAAFAQYVIAKGSIAINGISLTVAELEPASFVVWIIPHTLPTPISASFLPAPWSTWSLTYSRNIWSD